jgi:hypothetical protein
VAVSTERRKRKQKRQKAAKRSEKAIIRGLLLFSLRFATFVSSS